MASGKRFDNELFDDYRKRLREESRKIKLRLRSKVVWDSGTQGTYKKGDMKYE